MWEHTHDQLTSEPTLDICPSTHFMNPTYLTDIPRIYHAKTDRKVHTYIEHIDKHGRHASLPPEMKNDMKNAPTGTFT